MKSPHRSGTDQLTPARGMMAGLVQRYSVLGFDCSILEIHILAWLLERAILARGEPSPLGLMFVADRYGPHSYGLRQLLDALDGGFLNSERRLSNATSHDAIWLDGARRAEIEVT